MNREGFIFTMDAVLALVPIFIVMASVSTISYDPNPVVSIVVQQQAHDGVQLLIDGVTPIAEAYVTTWNVTPVNVSLDFVMTYSYLLQYSNSSNTTWMDVVGRCINGTNLTVVETCKNNAEDVFAANRIYYHDYTKHNFRLYAWLE